MIFLHFICWMSAILLLPVWLTYWPRKYTTRIDPHGDNSHQVWYDHPLPSQSLQLGDTLRDLVTLAFDLLTLNSCCWLVTCPTLPPSLKTLRLSVLLLWAITFPVGYHWKCVRGHCACAESRDPWVGGQKQLHFWNLRLRYAYYYTTFIGLRRRLRVVYSRAVQKLGPKMAVFGENGGQSLRFWFRDPQKALPCAEPRRLTYFASKSVRASRL